MKRKIALIMMLIISLVVVLPVLANAPESGTVAEGVSVPGIELGYTRAQVEAAYGPPKSCQSVEAIGDYASCSFLVDGGGQIWLRYRGPDGGNASNSPDDVVTVIRWYEQVSGWVTTAGVNTTLARENPQAVINAYPNADVTYTNFGTLYSVVDAAQGIEIIWSPDFYHGTVNIHMAIFIPREPAPKPEQQIHVDSIEMRTDKVKGQRIVRAFVQILDRYGYSVRNAKVTAHWTFPNGSVQEVQDMVNSGGRAYFEIRGRRLDRGIYRLSVDDVELSGFVFNRDASILEAEIYVK